MRIRWKLFWLLAAISLVPLVLLRTNSQISMERLAAALSKNVGDHLVADAEKRMQRLVEDHAHLLDSRRQALGLAVSMQAMAATAALAKAAAAPPAPFDPAKAVLLVESGMGMGRGMTAAVSGLTPAPEYFRILPDGSRVSLPIDRDRLSLRAPLGGEARNATTDLTTLATLLPTYRNIAGQAGSLAHFQTTLLKNGAAAIYPAIGSYPVHDDMRQSPWYVAAMALSGPVWTAPQADPASGRICVAVSRRVDGPDGKPAGATAILTPLDDLLASVTPSGHIAESVQTLLVAAATDSDGRPTLLVEAGQVLREHGHGWHTYVIPAPFAAPDAATRQAMAADVAAGRPGVRRMVCDGRESLVAYAHTTENEALLQIAPVADVLAEARATAEFVHDSIRRQLVFGLVIVMGVMVALLFVSLAASRAVTRPISALTAAARRLAQGDFSARVAARGTDEISELGRVFNDLAPRLDEHMRLCETLSLASEVQRNLLPKAPPQVPGLSIAAVSRYCDATGGDYYDFFPFDGPKAGRLGLAVGDVSGHGLEAALLMTTARALLRPRAARPGAPAEVVSDVNRGLTADTYGTGRFMTLFYMELDPAGRTAAYARAGHDPAFLYDPRTRTVSELTAKGMALGVFEEAVYETGAVAGLTAGKVLLVGSDGLWEAANPVGEMFGKGRVRDILAATAAGGAEAVLAGLITALDAFRGPAPLADDVTLVVVAFTD